MATTLGQVSVTLLLQAGQFLSGTKAAGTQLSALEKQGTMSSAKLSSSMSSLFKNVGGGLIAFGLLKKGLVDSIGKFYEAKDSSDKLTAALGGNIEKAKQFEEISARLQQQTIFGDELINDNFTFLAGQERTEEQMKKVMSAAVDYASFMKKDLSTEVKELSMTYEGNIGKLGRIDGRLKELTPEQLRNGAAVDLLAEKYNGWGEIVGNTMTGKIERFKNALDELQEGIGEGFMSGFAEELDSVSNSMLGVSVGAKDLGVGFGKLIGYTLQLVTGLKLASGVFAIVSNAAGKLKSVFVELIRAKKDFVNSAAGIPVIGEWFQYIADKANYYLNILRQIVGAQKQMTEGKAKFEGSREGQDANIGPTVGEHVEKKVPTGGNVPKLQEEKKELDKIEQLQEEINKLEAEHQELIKKYDVNSKFIKDHTASIKELKNELKELLAVEKERARDYEKNSRADGPRDMAKGTGGRDARSKASLMPDEDAWMEHWGKGISAATQIVNILNKPPDNVLTAFSQMLMIAQQIALLMNLSKAASFLGPLGGLFGALGSIFFRERGGDVADRQPYVVGEKGRELFVPKSSGIIIPNWITEAIVNTGGSLTGNTKYLASGGAVRGEMNSATKTIGSMAVTYLNGRILDARAKREIAKHGIYLENLSVKNTTY